MQRLGGCCFLWWFHLSAALDQEMRPWWRAGRGVCAEQAKEKETGRGDWHLHALLHDTSSTAGGSAATCPRIATCSRRRVGRLQHVCSRGYALCRLPCTLVFFSFRLGAWTHKRMLSFARVCLIPPCRSPHPWLANARFRFTLNRFEMKQPADLISSAPQLWEHSIPSPLPIRSTAIHE